MPIYPYICDSCSYEFDRLQKISDDPLKACPECGTDSLRKKLTAAAFHLKGTGWYETDFKNKEKKSDEKDQRKDGGDAKKDIAAKTTESKSSESKASGSSSGSDTGKSSSASKSAQTDPA